MARLSGVALTMSLIGPALVVTAFSLALLFTSTVTVVIFGLAYLACILLSLAAFFLGLAAWKKERNQSGIKALIIAIVCLSLLTLATLWVIYDISSNGIGFR